MSRFMTLMASLLLLTIVSSVPALAEETPQIVNLLDKNSGGRVVSCSSQYDEDRWAATNLIDAGRAEFGWSSAKGVFPQEIVFAFKDDKPVEFNRLSLLPFFKDIDVRWAKDIELLVSQETAPESFVSVGTYRIELLPNQQDFYFKPVQARYVKLRVLSNWGSNLYAEIGKVGLYRVSDQKGELSRLIERLEGLLADLKAYRDRQ